MKTTIPCIHEHQELIVPTKGESLKKGYLAEGKKLIRVCVVNCGYEAFVRMVEFGGKK